MRTSSHCPACDGRPPFDHEETCVYFIAYAQSLAASAGIGYAEAMKWINDVRGYPVRILPDSRDL